MRRRGAEVIAETALPAGVTADGYLLHPALLDACMQAMGVAMDNENGDPSTDLYMPVGVRGYRVFQPGAVAATCRVVVAPRAADAKSAEADVTLFDATGAPIAEALGFEMHRITRQALERLMRKSGSEAEWRFKVDWIQGVDDVPSVNVAGQNWLVFADETGAGEAFAGRMRQAGASVELLARPKKLDEKQIVAAVAKSAPIDQPLHGALFLWALDAPTGAADLAALETAQADQLNGALFALRTVVDRAARVIVATRGTQQAVTASADLVQAPIWSFAGVVAAENLTCGLTRVDLDPNSTSRDADALVAEAGATDREDRVAYRGGARYVARLARDQNAPPAEDQPVLLDITERGSLGNLALVPLERRSPGAGEVEIRVYATGLNFRDALNALGMYQGEPGPLGNECAGVVTAIGPGVTRLAVGDEVISMVDRSFATYVVAPEDKTVIKPRHVTFQEAATVPVTFLTSDYALRVLAGIKAGDRVLIHAVTGGVGMAAAQIALQAGAVVFGTAGSPAKRQMAKDLGVQFVSDSRSLSFVDDVKRDTNGEGVDIVLNSLAGDFIPASLGLVRAGGAFVEIGATSIWTAEAVAEAYPGVRYHPLYLGAVTAADPELIRGRLEDILSEMESGTLRPLPQTVFPLTQAESAFRYMGQGLHTGKIVITQPRPIQIQADGAYVLTGGLTGLGLTTAQKLVEQGARGIVLLGRRAPSAEALSAIASMEAAGANVRAAQVDVGDVAALAALLEDVRAQMGPIRGVLHAAGILDDGMMSELTPERIAAVMAPKVRGGWALHTLTLQDPLDFFVLFSSGASLMGSPGQGNYAAANGFLDGLANYRHARGLPSLGINWGSWAEVGMAAGVGADHHRRWAAIGLEMITPESGMDMLLQMLTTGAGPQIAAVPMVLSKLPPAMGIFYKNLLVQNATAVAVAAPVDMIAELKAAAVAERPNLLRALLSDQVLKVLALPAGQRIDPHESLLNLGLDSLMAMELRNRLQAGFGVRVAVADLLGGADVNQLCRIIMDELVFDDAGAQPKGAEQELEREHGEL
jgi:NADPH:quinone reductase-like Zn-dependent oxidoreductase/aryl carrier-like protein